MKLLENCLLAVALFPVALNGAVYTANLNSSLVRGSWLIASPASFIETSDIASNGSISISVDAVNQEINYDALVINFPEFTLQLSDEFTVGFGATKTINAEVTLNSFSITAFGTRVAPLTPSTGGKFLIDRFSNPSDWGALSGPVTGSFLIQGDTEVISQNFSVDVTDIFSAGNFEPIGPSELDTNNFPSELIFTRNFFVDNSARETIYDGNIEGVDYELVLRTGTGLDWFSDGVSLAPGAIPEPSEYAVTFGLVSLLFVGVWRRRKSKKVASEQFC